MISASENEDQQLGGTLFSTQLVRKRSFENLGLGGSLWKVAGGASLAAGSLHSGRGRRECRQSQHCHGAVSLRKGASVLEVADGLGTAYTQESLGAPDEVEPHPAAQRPRA